MATDYSAIPAMCNEAEVPKYTLPALRSREETLNLFRDQMYGWLPIEPPKMEVKLVESGNAVGGLATRKQFRVELANATGTCGFDLLLYLPAAAKSVPLFLHLNFRGNHAAQDDPAIVMPQTWLFQNDPPQPDGGRGSEASRWPVDMILRNGCAAATVYAGDLASDHRDLYRGGVLSMLPPPKSDAEAGSRGATIAAWAWGLSRALDALLALPEIDPSRVAVVGHSRMGKTALWAGACDERFSVVVSNNSGCGGAALSRRRFGERLIHINGNNPHWFARNFHADNEREAELPLDQHQLMAAIAPRALYVSSATEDQWADPHGEYLALAAAAPAWNETLPNEMPPADQPLLRRRIGYHLRTGSHDITTFDWQQFIAFAKQAWPET